MLDGTGITEPTAAIVRDSNLLIARSRATGRRPRRVAGVTDKAIATRLGAHRPAPHP